MAWFKKTSSDQVTPQEFTLERLIASLHRIELHFEQDDSYILAGFPSCFIIFNTNFAPHAFCVSARAHQSLPLEKIAELNEFTASVNRDTRFGVMVAIEDSEDGKVVGLTAQIDIPVLTPAGCTDEQLDEWVQFTIHRGISAMDSYLEAFNLPKPSED